MGAADTPMATIALVRLPIAVDVVMTYRKTGE